MRRLVAIVFVLSISLLVAGPKHERELLATALRWPFHGDPLVKHLIKSAAQVIPDKRETVAQLKQKLQEASPPSDQVEERDTLARQQAEAAATLLRLGQTASVWPLLRHSSDPSRRTYLIPDFARMGADPLVIIRRLDAEKDISARRALILSLGEFTDEQLPKAQRRSLMMRLLRWYRDDPDSGIHAAIDWLTRHGNQGEAKRRLNWQGAAALAEIDQHLAGRPIGRRNWYVTRERQTMVVVRGPVEFRMGSPEYEPGRTPDETLHRVRIPRSFAIAGKEVTVAQFRRFLEANPKLERRYQDALKDRYRGFSVMQRFSPDDDGPQIVITWYEAAQYCNWLSKQEGIPESEWAYPTNLDGIKDGMELSKGYLHRIGYRLPTEAEWEYAARAGSGTARFYGSSEAPLKEYAWYSRSPPRSKGDPISPTDPQRTWIVGQLKPNDLGLFDVYGNVWEWGQNRRQEYRVGDDVHEDREDDVLNVADTQARTRRGGSFSYEAAVMRSAHRGSTNYFPMRDETMLAFVSPELIARFPTNQPLKRTLHLESLSL